MDSKFKNKALEIFFKEILKNEREDILISGDYFDETKYEFVYNKKSQMIKLYYFFYIYDEVSAFTEKDFFQTNFSEYLMKGQPENYSVFFQIKVNFLTEVFLRKIQEKFCHIKEMYYLQSLKELFKLLMDDKLKKSVFNLNKNDFLCLDKNKNKLSCFFIQQEISKEEKYYYNVFFNEFAENLLFEKINIFFEKIDFANDPSKIVRLFPEIVNTLEPDNCFLLLFIFDPNSFDIDIFCKFITQIKFFIRKYYFAVKSTVNKFIKKNVEELEEIYFPKN